MFSKVYLLSKEEFGVIIKNFKIEQYKKGDEILSYGQIERRTSMVVSKIVIQTHMIDDEIFTNDISLSGMYYNNLMSYLEESPSIETQTTLTDVEILYLEKNYVEERCVYC